MEKHMEDLARQHVIDNHSKYSRRLLKSSEKNWLKIRAYYRFARRIPDRLLNLVPSAQWLIDNYYVVNRETRIIRQDFGLKACRRLPAMKEGTFRGYPRIYALASEMLKATDMHMDEDGIVLLLNAYQAVKPLTIAELWAFPMILKLCLINNISDVCACIVESVRIKQKADAIMDEVLSKPWSHSDEVAKRLIERMETGDIFNFNYSVQVLYRLKEMDLEEGFLKQCLLSKQCKQELDIPESIHMEAQYQGTLQVQISSAVTSLIQVSAIDWEKLFDRISVVGAILSMDPSGVYPRMSFDTRDEYHHEIELTARRTGMEEVEIARNTVELCLPGSTSGNGEIKSHVGYYLLGNGRKQLEKALRYNPGVLGRLGRWLKLNPGFVYFPGVFFSAAAVSVLLLLYTFGRSPDAGIPEIAVMMVFTAILSLTASVEVMNYVLTRCVRPKKLPSMDFEKSIPEEFRTVVVMPVILDSAHQIKKYARSMEAYYLSNCDKSLSFAILADLKDSDSQELPGDGEIINQGIECVKNLNSKYTGSEKGPFYFLTRRRKWNEREGCWMGWERKRGKLEEFNSLILGSSNTSFNVVIGDTGIFPRIKYVITIDADTELTQGSAAKLIGVMAHPLNRPVLNKDGTRVTGGYALLQPRVGIRADSVNETFFSRIFAGQAGVDPYTNAVSDIYQDTFGEGSFTGKGIYDVRVFNDILTGTIPENTVLSHDLLEGSFVRCALATDIELMDGYPSTIASYFSREHRWTRGDWQLLPWLLGRDSLSALSRWKIIDNMRRSLVPASQLGVIFLGALVLDWHAAVWAALAVFSTLFSLAVNMYRTTAVWLKKCSGETYISNFTSAVLVNLLQGLILFILIPYRAYINLDAITRVLFRMLVSKRKLLEWKTAEAVERTTTNNLAMYIRRMWAGPLAGLLISAPWNGLSDPGAVVAAVLWIAGPFTGFFISSRRYAGKPPALKPSEIRDMRMLARKTWRYFEEFFTAQDNWLTPDNYQVYPGDVLARRTSPTNLGMQILSTLSARDLGYIGLNELADRFEKIFSSISKMELWHGHLFNWYDTRTLEVLHPKYVSTVDSGNFATSLVVLKNALKEIMNQPVLGAPQLEGLRDTAHFTGMMIEFDLPRNGHEWKTRLEDLKSKLDACDKAAGDKWTALLYKQCNEFLNDIDDFELDKREESLPALSDAAAETGGKAAALTVRINSLIEDIEKRIAATDFKPLYDNRRSLFRVGFNVSANLPDSSYYDLLASESRLTSFIAIAKGDVPRKHWFKLGRPLTLIHGKAVLISWSGTMFEYLLPNLILKVFPGTLLEQTSRLAVKAQIDYGKKKRVPWGISESGYYRFDQLLNYQYRAFGVPALGFRSDLRKSLVIAPYAALLAISVSPREVYRNIKQLQALNAEGEYGFYEALDFLTPVVQNPRKYKVIQSFMIHHQGMNIVALDNLVNRDIMQKRFHSEAMVKGTELILEERQPCGIIIKNDGGHAAPSVAGRFFRKKRDPRIVKDTRPQYPCAHVLSNGQYTVMIAGDGSGTSTWNNISINRWRPVSNGDGYGTFFYIRNTSDRKFWSAAYLPAGVEPDDYKVVFSPDKAEFRRLDGHVETRMEVVVSPKDSLEIRQITFINKGLESVNLEVTSYFEPVIDNYENDSAHPAFSKLFISTEYIEERKMLLAARRPRKEEDMKRYVFNAVLVRGRTTGDVEYETDRGSFIGRGNTLKTPGALNTELPLPGTAGNVLDPIMSMRVNVSVSPGRSAVVTYIIGISDSRDKAVELCSRHQNIHMAEDVFKMAFVDSEVEMQYLGVTFQQVNAIQDLVGSIYYPSRLLRANADLIEKNNMGQRDLWKFGISGDYPIMLFRIRDKNHINVLKEAVLSYEYLRKNGVKLDFVILNEEDDDYFQPLSQQISDVVTNRRIYSPNARNSGIFVLKARNMSKDELYLLLSAARVVLSEKKGVVARRTKRFQEDNGERPVNPALPLNTAPTISADYEEIMLSPMELKDFNGIGGFSEDGREYVIVLKGEHNTPAPWVNIIANDSFGCLVSSSGTGYTWSVNSRENKITGWYNDPVVDTPSEGIYIRDEDTGELFSPAPCPIRGRETYRIRHGFGYSIFEHGSHGLAQALSIFVSNNHPVKIYRLSLENRTSRDRRLSVCFYAEWVMGVSRDTTAPYIITGADRSLNLFTARNPYNTEFKGRVAFIGSSASIASYTGDKSEFIGPRGSTERPQGLLKKELSGRTGAAFDPCGAVMVNIDIKAGQAGDVVFILGEAGNMDEASAISEVYCRQRAADEVLNEVRASWEQVLDKVRVKTPDEAMDRLINGWLLYQVLACRIRARSAFYQSGGAYGFRDQLQDVMALLHTAPETARQHIIRCCARQFIEGDVQHWWHHDSGRGVRTRISDDLLWLPYVTAVYIETTGDHAILDEMVPYLEGERLGPEEGEKYFTPVVSEEKGSVYEHCLKAIERGMRFGENGLPLMGAGDWNDGMNRVGCKGRGESVWLGWFLYKLLKDFTVVCRIRGDEARAVRYREAADRLLESIEEKAWDGEWYIRAFFDSGQPMGSRQNSECRIDSISQSWGIISGGADRERAFKSMESLRKYLVKEEDQMILLLTPPFDKSSPGPGYIKGYLPGIRENGGQYTHAAVWNIIAYAEMGNGDAAYEIFRMLNPINHARTYSEAMKYRLEPYVMPADVYSKFPHSGRGGWSWYTGSAGWMYQAGLQWMLGIRRKGGTLLIKPVIPREWEGYSVQYVYGTANYIINVENPDHLNCGPVFVTVDGKDMEGDVISLKDDGMTHSVKVVIRPG